MSGIASLPPEILAHVLSYLPRKQDKLREQEEQDNQVEPLEQAEQLQKQDKLCGLCEQEKRSSEPPVYLPSYASVCKTWQHQVELKTFREIDVMSSELEYLSKIMTESRRPALRVIEYSIVMSEDVKTACSEGTKLTGEAEKVVEEVVEKEFTAAITELLVLLQEWEDSNPLMSVSIKITHIYSYDDGQGKKTTRCGDQWSSTEQDMFIHTFKPYSRLLHLGSLDDLRRLKSVTKLQVGMGNLNMTEDSMARLAMKFRALKALDLQIGHMAWYAEGTNWGREFVPELRYRMCEYFHLLLHNPWLS
jgi:hypothetical protein